MDTDWIGMKIDNIFALAAQSDFIDLNAQNRVPLPPTDRVLVLREGMVAVDAMPVKGKLQVLDFLIAGDFIASSKILLTRKVSLRAITNCTLVSLPSPFFHKSLVTRDFYHLAIAQCLKQIERVSIYQLMTGRLETEERVASFLLAFALRSCDRQALDDGREIMISLPMSRIDIANFLVINCDTLSRTMMRFCERGLIDRLNRHAVRIKDLEALKRKSPITNLLSEVLSKRNDKPAEVFELEPAKQSAFMPRKGRFKFSDRFGCTSSTAAE